ncbi:MAG: isochorismate synthase [Acidimicrobiia bacterium]
MTAAPVPLTSLRAVTRELVAPANLLDQLGPDGVAWLHDGGGFVTSGVAARVEPAAAAGVLAEIEHDDAAGRPGTGPLAVGALPFDPRASRELIVPRRIVGRDAHGRGWVTELGAASSLPPEALLAPTAFTVRELMSHDQWCAAVTAALDAIARGDLEKVVLARAVEVEADHPFDVPTILERLLVEQPGCFVYAVDGMVGASPELLVRRRTLRIECRPMAGTVMATDEAALQRLRASAKDAREHRVVVDAIVESLGPLCERLLVGAEPEVARLASVAHLATPIRGTLHDPAPDALAIARTLHPTPAVGGMPRAAALDAIDALEPTARERYAGPVGWIDARGDGEWAVALRGAAIDGTRATLHAGAGIVAGSVPDDEWRETDAKLEPMMRALTRT